MDVSNLSHVVSRNGRDVDDLKIYYDSDIKQYRVLRICEVCGRKLGCYCYNSVDDAISTSEEVTWMCEKHILREIWFDYDMAGEIDAVCGTNLSKMTEENHYEDRSTEINTILDSVTEEQAESIIAAFNVDDNCCEWAGDKCNV